MNNTRLQKFKKMAGTSAVFVSADYDKASPVERDGMIWSAEDLHLDTIPERTQRLPAMANVLALEGLEEYDPPSNGDVREVSSMALRFVYLDTNRAWIQLDDIQ